ncbi:CU044_5270 family protein [Actinomycetes bacterium KLBMP 9797]
MDEIDLVARLRPRPDGPAPVAVARARARLRAATHNPAGVRRARLAVRWRLAGAAALAVAVTASLVALDGGAQGPRPAAAAELLDRAARTAAAQPYQAPRPDQFAFTDRVIVEPGFREQARAWQSVGDPDATPVLCFRRVTDPPSTFDCAALPGHALPAPVDSVRMDTVEYLAALPRDPERLLARLRADASRDDVATLAGIIADLVASPLPPPDVRAAMLTAVATVDGVTAVPSVADAAGRTGTAVTWIEDGIRHELIFDADDAAYLGYRMLRGDAVLHSTALLGGGVVDRPKELP